MALCSRLQVNTVAEFGFVAEVKVMPIAVAIALSLQAVSATTIPNMESRPHKVTIESTKKIQLERWVKLPKQGIVHFDYDLLRQYGFVRVVDFDKSSATIYSEYGGCDRQEHLFKKKKLTLTKTQLGQLRELAAVFKNPPPDPWEPPPLPHHSWVRVYVINGPSMIDETDYGNLPWLTGLTSYLNTAIPDIDYNEIEDCG